MGDLTTSSLSIGPGSTKSRTLAITQHQRCRVRTAATGAAMMKSALNSYIADI
tara:strand:- start:784 stop:942 length:159 start_codon:yes stop_codon:yes gene_type:complete